MEFENGAAARIPLSDSGERLWSEAVETALGPKTRLPDFYESMRAAEDTVPSLPAIDPGPDTHLELPLQALTRVAPDYPELARRTGVDGVVQIRVLVGPDSLVHRAEIVRSIPMLDDAATRAVRQWRFEPAAKDGKRLWAWTTVPLRFSLH